MNAKWLAVPALLVLTLAVIILINQPKVNPVDDVSHVDVGGDEYLGEDYITPEEEGIGDFELNPNIPSDYLYPTSISDCDSASDFERDWCLEQYAIVSADPRGCELTSDRATQDDCYTQVAVLREDASLCENVKVGYSECYTDVAIETGNSSLCEKGSYEVQQCITAANAGDYNLCPEGFDRRICNDAVTERNPSLCTEELVVEGECYDGLQERFVPCEVTERIRDYTEVCYLEIALNTNQASLCNQAGEASDHCFFKIATTLNNASICENLTETRDNCVAWVAFNTNNPDLCYQAGSEAESCLADLA